VSNAAPCRVEILDKGGVTVDRFSGEVAVVYESVEDLPKWMQERLAVLMVAGVNNEVLSVGTNVNAHVFWIDE
jgi:hypothetical protein